MNTISPHDLTGTPYAVLLDYPAGRTAQLEQRCRELRQLGIDDLLLAGPALAGGYPVLGLGYCGLVLLGQWQEKRVAIKLLRSDSTQPDLRREAAHLRRANLVGVGPQLFAASDNILVMEYLSGLNLADWLASPAPPQPSLKQLLRTLLQDAFTLDRAGVDHGALRCVAEHAIVGEQRATLLDFSQASLERRPANLTTLVPGLFWGTRLAEAIGRQLILPEPQVIIPLLRHYKDHATSVSYNDLLARLPL